MTKRNLRFLALISVLALVIVTGIVLYSAGAHNNSSPAPTPFTALPPTVNPTITLPPTPTHTPNSGHTVTYSELSRNQSMIVIQLKLEPNCYIFQLNATSVILTQGAARISANTNEPVIIGTQCSTLIFPINGYNGTDYCLSSGELPLDSVWIKQ